jgi:pantothenate kinase type III
VSLAAKEETRDALLVVDIGNTNVSLGLFDYPAPRAAKDPAYSRHHWRVGTHRDHTADEVGLVLTSLFAQAKRDARKSPT